jgi:Na+-driven multidrug efflux pump
VYLAVVLALCGGAAFYFLRNYIAYIYTNDIAVIEHTGNKKTTTTCNKFKLLYLATYAPLVAIDFVISSMSYVLQGILEGIKQLYVRR